MPKNKRSISKKDRNKLLADHDNDNVRKKERRKLTAKDRMKQKLRPKPTKKPFDAKFIRWCKTLGIKIEP